MTNLIGKEIGGYRILQQIGMGGMAKVYKAYQAKMDRVVALKVLPEHYSKDETFLKRFDQEARIIANLENRNILSVFDYGEDDGVAFLAMRYLRGGTLKDVLNSAENRRLSMTDVAHVVAQLANALDYSHEQGIVHRDMKPSNVLVDENGDCYLTDFGIAKVLDSTSHLTSTGSTLGTPAYMSPEQAAGKNVGTHSDIYSLGIILYELMVGKVPFDSDTPFATVLAHVNEPIPLPSQANPDIPQRIERVILKALAKNPEDRYRSAGDLSTALFDALADEDIHVGGHSSLKVSDTLQRLSGGLAQTKPNDELTVDDIALAKTQQRKEMLRKYMPVTAILVIVGLLITVGTLVMRPNGSADSDATLDFTQAAAMMGQATETQQAVQAMTATQSQANKQATSTQVFANRNMTNTVVALTPSASPTVAPDTSVSGALRFSGEDGHGSIPFDVSFIQRNEITLEAWVKIPSFPDCDLSEDWSWGGGEPLCYLIPIINQANSGGTSGNYSLFVAKGGVMFTYEKLDSRAIAEISMPEDEWVHIAVTHRYPDGDNIRFYVNGENVPLTFWLNDFSEEITGNGYPGAGDVVYIKEDFTVGVMRGGWITSIGYVDELRIWSTYRSQEEIAANMYSELDGGESGLVAYWNFNQPAGQSQAVDIANGLVMDFRGEAAISEGVIFNDLASITDLSALQAGTQLIRCGEDLCFEDNQGNLTEIGLYPTYSDLWGHFSLSPDGSQIIFAACLAEEPDCPPDLYIANKDGSNVVPFLGHPGLHYMFPSWSPDGDWISFHNNGSLDIIRLDGTGQKEIVKGGAYCPNGNTWSPDNQRIAFIGDLGICQVAVMNSVWVINADGTEMNLIFQTDEFELVWDIIAWSPDGSQVAVLGENGYTYLINAACNELPDGCDDSSYTVLTPFPEHWLHTFYPQWVGESSNTGDAVLTPDTVTLVGEASGTHPIGYAGDVGTAYPSTSDDLTDVFFGESVQVLGHDFEDRDEIYIRYHIHYDNPVEIQSIFFNFAALHEHRVMIYAEDGTYLGGFGPINAGDAEYEYTLGLSNVQGTDFEIEISNSATVWLFIGGIEIEAIALP